MSGELSVVAGPDEGMSVALADGKTWVVGRGDQCEVRLRDARVSRRHCQIQTQRDAVVLNDLGSTTGTLVNGQSVKERKLVPGDVIRIGNTKLVYQSTTAPADAATMGVQMPSAKAPKPADGADDLKQLSGQEVAHYLVGDEVAKGSSGKVFQAVDTRTNKLVAMKVLWPLAAQNDTEIRRFVRAMKTMVSVRHPNLVRLLGAGKNGPYCWVAMEYVEGESLTKVIERIGVAGMLDWTHAFRVGVHIGRALEAAYQHSIIHRNITPSNILIQAQDKAAKLGDMMLAKALQGTLAQQITRPGEMVGNACYMSPEQTVGTAEIDTRSDIYCLGATLYAMLSGRPPVQGETLSEIVHKIHHEEPPAPKAFQLSIPDMFDMAVRQMLAKRPQDRHQTPAELVEHLARIGKFQNVSI
jgi:eukaryotic-like serine/threonine-protein kinase